MSLTRKQPRTVNTSPHRSSITIVRQYVAISQVAKVGLVVLMALTVFVSFARPISRPADSISRSLGLRQTRLNLRSEAAAETDTFLPSLAVTVAKGLIVPLVALSLVVLKDRRTAFHSAPVRRLKRPRRRTASSLSSD